MDEDHGPELFTKRDLRRFIIPLILERTLAALMGMADTLMVANLGDAAISGVACVDTLNLLLLYVFEAIAMGGNVVCAQYIGRGELRSANNTARQLMFAVLVAGAALAAPCFSCAEPVLRTLYPSAEADVLNNGRIYLAVTALSYPFLALYTASAALYRATGNSKLPVIVIMIGNALNVIGNALFIFAMGMGVFGAALATLLSRIFCCAVLLIFQVRPGSIVSLKGEDGFRPNIRDILRIMRIGIPTAVENSMFQFGKIIIQGTVIALGTAMAAAQAIIVQIEVVSLHPSLAVGSALLTIAGQYLGAGRPMAARRQTIRLTLLSQAFCAVLCAITIAVTPGLSKLAGLSAEGVELAWSIMLFICVFRTLVWPAAFTLPNCLRAAGDVSFTMSVSVASMWLFRVFLSFILCRTTDLGLWGIWIGWISDWTVRALLFSLRFARGKWMLKTVL